MSQTHDDTDRAGQLHHVEPCVSDLERSADSWGWLLDELGYDSKNGRS